MTAPQREVVTKVDYECETCGFTCGTQVAWARHLKACALYEGQINHELNKDTVGGRKGQEEKISATGKVNRICAPCEEHVTLSDTVLKRHPALSFFLSSMTLVI